MTITLLEVNGLEVLQISTLDSMLAITNNDPRIGPSVVKPYLNIEDQTIQPANTDEMPAAFSETSQRDPVIRDQSEKISWDGGDNLTDTLLDRVYVDPDSISVDFITEYQEFVIVIWNAWRRKPVDITDITVLNQTGTGMLQPDLPKTIAKTWSTTLTLLVYQEGPPTQDTVWTVTVDGDDYDIDVTGIRVIPFVEEPSWDSTLKLVYNFLTAIARNPEYLREQRRPLQRYPFRDTQLVVNASENALHKLINILHYGKDKTWAIPIYSERFSAYNIVSGAGQITVVEDMTYHYHFQNTTSFIMIVNHETGEAEVKEVDYVSGSTIYFTSEITESQPAYLVDLYPCYFCYLKSAKLNPESSKNASLSIVFGEYKPTGGV